MAHSNLLQPLVDTIEMVKIRIAQHGQSLRDNETRTRAALIDPVLGALGWDVSDPNIVTPEFAVGGGRADYALLDANGSALVAVEAKRLNENLTAHRQQMVNYANMGGVGHAGLTDGNRWELYRVFTAKPLPLDERRTMDVQLSGAPAHESALKLLLLWRPNIASAHPQTTTAPIVEEDLPLHPPETSYNPDPAPATPIISDDESWPVDDELTLVDYEGFIRSELHDNPSRRGQVGPAGNPIRKKTPTPKGIRFPDGERQPTTYAAELLVRTTDWLYRSGRLGLADMPFASPKGRHIVHTDGTRMDNAKSAGHGKYFVEIKIGHDYACRLAIRLLEECGVNPAKVFVER